MAWRPTDYLIEGELDNTTPGKVVGWMRFKGLSKRVTFKLKGDFHRDIRGAKIQFTGAGETSWTAVCPRCSKTFVNELDRPKECETCVMSEAELDEADVELCGNREPYMEGFDLIQEGNVGDITAGLPPADYVEYPYIEWYSGNGRVVIELDKDQIEVIGRPIPAMESDPNSRQKQASNMADFLMDMSRGLGS